MWQGTNLNKRDITLDLTSDDGRELVRRLVREADVVVENFSPRVVEQFGLDYESLVELKPDVILVRMPGFGLQGPVARLRRLGAQLRADIGDGGCHRLRRRSAVQPAGARRPHRRGARGCRPAGRARAPAPHRRRPTHRDRADRGGGVGRRRTRDRVLDERCRRAARGQPPPRLCCRACTRQRSTASGWRSPSATTPTGRDSSRRCPAPTCNEGSHTTRSTRRSPPGPGPCRRQSWSISLPHNMFRPSSVLTADRMYDIAQLDERGYYQKLEHPITGAHRYPGWPFRITPGPVAPPPIRRRRRWDSTTRRSCGASA